MLSLSSSLSTHIHIQEENIKKMTIQRRWAINHLENLAHAEISDLHPAAARHQEIIRFDVPVDDILRGPKKITFFSQFGHRN